MTLEAGIKYTQRDITQLVELQKGVQIKAKTQLLKKCKGLNPKDY